MNVIHFETSADIEKKFEEIDVDPHARDIMLEKFQFYVLEICDVKTVEANILKQEMLILGGEAAVNRHSISCSVPTTTVLLSGTKKIFRNLYQRIQSQVGDLPKYADNIKELLFS